MYQLKYCWHLSLTLVDISIIYAQHDVCPFVSLQEASERFRFLVPNVWKDLPLHVASAPSLAVFRQRQKTFLFSRSYQDTIIRLVCYYHHSSLLSGHLWPLQ